MHFVVGTSFGTFLQWVPRPGSGPGPGRGPVASSGPGPARGPRPGLDPGGTLTKGHPS